MSERRAPRTSTPSAGGPVTSRGPTSGRPRRARPPVRCATTSPTTRSSPRSPASARCSGCCSTPVWRASASPAEYGGQGLTPAHQRVLNEELAGYEFPTRFQAPTLSPCAAVLLDFGTEEQKRRHIPAILKGEEIWMQFLSEPSGGSDVAGALTSAVRDGDEWVLNGSKIWTTGAWWSDWGLCLARTNWDVPKHRGLTVFIFPIRQAGHRRAPDRDAQRLEGVLPGVPDRRPGARLRPGRRRRRRLDGGHPLDVPRAHAHQLTAGDRPGGIRARRYRCLLTRRRRGPRRRSPVRAGRARPVGEARMLDIVDRELRQRIGEGIATGAMVDQSAAITQTVLGGLRRPASGPSGSRWPARPEPPGPTTTGNWRSARTTT